MQWEKRHPHRALDIPECPCRLSHPFTGILPCFFFFPLVLLMKITQPLKPSPYGMDTSTAQDDSKITYKNSCSFHGAFCWRCVSRSYPPSPPLPATRQNTIKPSGIWNLQKSKKRLSVSRGKACETFLTVYRVEKNGKERSAPCSAPPKRWIIWPLPQYQDARRLGGPVSPSSSASIQKLAGRRQPARRHGCGAKSSATRPGARTAQQLLKNTLLYGQRHFLGYLATLAQEETAIAFRRQQGKQAKTA